jgi:hypothetical protein
MCYESDYVEYKNCPRKLKLHKNLLEVSDSSNIYDALREWMFIKEDKIERHFESGEDITDYKKCLCNSTLKKYRCVLIKKNCDINSLNREDCIFVGRNCLNHFKDCRYTPRIFQEYIPGLSKMINKCKTKALEFEIDKNHLKSLLLVYDFLKENNNKILIKNFINKFGTSVMPRCCRKYKGKAIEAVIKKDKSYVIFCNSDKFKGLITRFNMFR